MNTKIYKAVHDLAERLMSAAEKDDNANFKKLYSRLEAICTEHDNTDKDHPVQWETLADFTEDLDQAMALYEKALLKATAINSKDFMTSIAFAIANIQLEHGQTQAAIASLRDAKTSANKIEDKAFKDEINQLLASLADEKL
jgi:hypothetical protein